MPWWFKAFKFRFGASQSAWLALTIYIIYINKFLTVCQWGSAHLKKIIYVLLIFVVFQCFLSMNEPKNDKNIARQETKIEKISNKDLKFCTQSNCVSQSKKTFFLEDAAKSVALLSLTGFPSLKHPERKRFNASNHYGIKIIKFRPQSARLYIISDSDESNVIMVL